MRGHHGAALLQRRVAALSRTDVHALVRAYRQLSAADLRALASFPGQPHPLIHAVLASTHCLLLEIAREQHEALELEALPWQLLRLELLADTPRVHGKLAKRLRRLQEPLPDAIPKQKKQSKRRRGVALAQRRFVYHTLGPLMFCSDNDSATSDADATTSASESLLQAFARVSSIGAQLASWVFSCLFLAEHSSEHRGHNFQSRDTMPALRPSLGCTTTERLADDDDPDDSRSRSMSVCHSPKKLLPQLHTQEPAHSPKTHKRARAPLLIKALRAGVKIGSHYVLFQTHVGAALDSKRKALSPHATMTPLATAATASTEWAVLRIETHRRAAMVHRALKASSDPATVTLSNALRERTAMMDDGFWRPRERLPARLAQALCCEQRYERLPHIALLTTLLQLGLHAGVFANPRLEMCAASARASASVGTPSTWDFFKPPSPEVGVSLVLKFAVVTTAPAVGTLLTRDDRSTQYAHERASVDIVLGGIGSATVSSIASAAELRVEIEAALKMSGGSNGSLAFLYRGSVLPQVLEPSLSVLAFMPFALVVCKTPSLAPSAQLVRSSNIKLQRLHVALSTALRNAGPPDHFVQMETQETKPHTHFTVDSTVTYYAMQQPVVDASATSAVLTEFFVHWRTFVHFQQLQDSTAVLEAQLRGHWERAPKKKTQRFKTEAQRIAEFQLEREALRPTASALLLPSKRFRREIEYLEPLYALADVTTASTAVLMTPFTSELIQVLLNSSVFDGTAVATVTARITGVRLVLYDEDYVVHLRNVHATTSPDRSASLEIAFERDASCPLDTLLCLKNAYVWQVVRQRDALTDANAPERWLQDVYRFVTHPTLDFQRNNDSSSSVPKQFTHFRVPVACTYVEQMLEARFWSRGVDWTPYLCATDICERVFRPKYDAMCLSHPPSLSIDSVKFSKLLRETGLQPHILSIGDAAFLFASHRAAGSHYEMDFDGFVAALEHIARMVFPAPARASTVVVDDARHDRSPLTRLFFERMVDAPSMAVIWRDLIDTWRLTCKTELLVTYARAYAAATRLQSLWKCFCIRRMHVQALARMKAERLAATTIQSVERKRRVYQRFHNLKRATVYVQRRIKARFELRCLRHARAALIERMRLHIVHWMRQRLCVLREWKKINARWVARRERVWAKRKRLICTVVCCLETRRFRFALYHADHMASRDTPHATTLGSGAATEPADNSENDAAHYELEITEPATSWWRFVRVPHALAAQFIREDAEERAHHDGDTTGVDTVARLAPLSLSRDATSLQSSKITLSLTRGPRGAKTRASYVLNAVVKRLRPLLDAVYFRRKCVAYYRHPVETSLGKLVFSGAVTLLELPPLATDRDSSSDSDDTDSTRCTDTRVLVKVLQRTSVFTTFVYSPVASTLRRWDVSALFITRVLQFVGFEGRTLDPDSIGVQETLNEKETDAQRALLELQRLFQRTRARVVQALVSYVVVYGLAPPVFENAPEVVASKTRAHQERRAREAYEQRAREEARVIAVQACVRRLLARKRRLQFALATYKKQFDVATRTFVYIQRFDVVPSSSSSAGALRTTRVKIYREKPASLFDADVPLPLDEWQRMSPRPLQQQRENSQDDDGETRALFFNPFRGAFSRLNDDSAARRIQRWYRAKMWIGVAKWSLPQLARALRFHSQYVASAGANDLDAMKRHALHLFIMKHEFKRALSVYEAILKTQSEDIEVLVGLALLLIYTCRYPTKQSWSRALALLAQADALVQARVDSVTTLADVFATIEETCLCWKLFLEAASAHAMGIYAVYLQCVRHDLDKAELLYRRALDADPSNAFVLENYERLERERAPDGIYCSAGPSAIARWRAHETSRIGAHWAVMDDPAARIRSTQRFYRDVRTGACQWQAPPDDDNEDMETSARG